MRPVRCRTCVCVLGTTVRCAKRMNRSVFHLGEADYNYVDRKKNHARWTRPVLAPTVVQDANEPRGSDSVGSISCGFVVRQVVQQTELTEFQPQNASPPQNTQQAVGRDGVDRTWRTATRQTRRVRSTVDDRSRWACSSVYSAIVDLV